MQKEIKDKNENIVKEEKQTPEMETALFKQKYEEIDDKYKRMYAEFENYKKRTEKESSKTYENAKANILIKLLPIMDSFEQAIKAETTDESYRAGMDLIFKQFEEFAKSMGIEEIQSDGAKFDPEIHEAISIVEDSGLDSGMIVETFRKGYKVDTQVLRHSMVIVQK